MESEKKTAEVTVEAPEMVELTDVPAVIWIPDNAVEAVLTITVFHDGELINVEKRMDMGAVRHAIREADENYLDPDAVFTITDKGKRLAASLEAIDR